MMRNSEGFTLIELSISMVLASILILIFSTVVIQSAKLYSSTDSKGLIAKLQDQSGQAAFVSMITQVFEGADELAGYLHLPLPVSPSAGLTPVAYPAVRQYNPVSQAYSSITGSVMSQVAGSYFNPTIYSYEFYRDALASTTVIQDPGFKNTGPLFIQRNENQGSAGTDFYAKGIFSTWPLGIYDSVAATFTGRGLPILKPLRVQTTFEVTGSSTSGALSLTGGAIAGCVEPNPMTITIALRNYPIVSLPKAQETLNQLKNQLVLVRRRTDPEVYFFAFIETVNPIECAWTLITASSKDYYFTVTLQNGLLSGSVWFNLTGTDTSSFETKSFVGAPALGPGAIWKFAVSPHDYFPILLTSSSIKATSVAGVGLNPKEFRINAIDGNLMETLEFLPVEFSVLYIDRYATKNKVPQVRMVKLDLTNKGNSSAPLSMQLKDPVLASDSSPLLRPTVVNDQIHGGVSFVRKWGTNEVQVQLEKIDDWN